MDFSKLNSTELNYLYQHGDYELKNKASVHLAAMQMGLMMQRQRQSKAKGRDK